MKRRRFSSAQVRRMYAFYRIAKTVPEVAAKYGLRPTQVYGLFRLDGFKCRVWRGGSPKRIKLELIEQMHADYQTISLSAVGRKYGRCGTQIRELFVSRGFSVRPFNQAPFNPKNGQILPFVPTAAKELAAIIAKQTKIRIPDELRLEWRHWPLAKRAAFVARVRAKLKPERDRPNTPFSRNVEPFDYGSPRAHEIVAQVNRGLSSRNWKVKIDLCTQGVIFRGELWFWSPKTGYERGPWTKEHGRPLLHHVLWEERNGKVPAGHVVRCADGNPNNLAAKNLILANRNDVCRESQAKWLMRKSREQTALLLERSTRKGNEHGRIETLEAIVERTRARIPSRKAA